jgi:L-alanine-DL-glutamate epimerase-like enolase superfamily enzyme
VNHTFTSNLALSASLQPYAGLSDSRICEYPTALSSLATELTTSRIAPNANGEIEVPDAPGLGVTINPAALKTYAVDVEIKVKGRTIFAPPKI